MILNYYCFEINGRLSHVRPCMICGVSRTVARPSPPQALQGRAQHPASAGLGTTRVTSRPRNKLLQQTFFFFKGNVCYLESYLKYTYSKKQSPWLGVFLQPGRP